MTNSTGSSAAADGHEQSIGAASPLLVDGIAGSHPGTQQPSGAHVNAGGGAEQRQGSIHDSRPERARIANGARLIGMDGRGVTHVAGAVGMLGVPRSASGYAESSPDAVSAQDGVALSVQGNMGDPSSRQHASGQ